MTLDRPQHGIDHRLTGNFPSGFEKGASVGLSPGQIREINPDFYAGPPPAGASGMKSMKRTQTTRYYTPIFHGTINRKTLRMEGAGIHVDNQGRASVLSSRGEKHKITRRNMRGRGASKIRTTLTTYKTIAVDPRIIPIGSWVYVNYGKSHRYTGWYRAEDTGGGIKGNQIDVFTGVGKANYRKGGKQIPSNAKEIIWFTDGKIHTEMGTRRETMVANARGSLGGLSETPAQQLAELAPEPLPVDLPKSGDLHNRYIEDISSLTEFAENDRKKLGESTVPNIRFNHRLLNPAEEGEKDEQKIVNLKTETARRIAAYTSVRDGDWYTLDYSSIGGDEHLYGIGLGDVLLDPNVKDVLINRGGEFIQATRGVPTSGNAAGRQSFVDEQGEYIATYDGDRFKVLSSKEMGKEEYLKALEKDNSVRETEAKRYSVDEVLTAANAAGGAVEEEVSEDAGGAFAFLNGGGHKGKVDLKTGQKRWVLGSSKPRSIDRFKSTNTGICGIEMANSEGFLGDFKKYVWPKIEKMDMPGEIVLMGLASNSLKEDASDEDVQSEIDRNIKIAKFFEGKGVSVKISNVFVGENAAVKKFNKKLEKDYSRYFVMMEK